VEPVFGKIDEENNWDNDTLCEIKEGPADCIRAGEVVKTFQKMKRKSIKIQVCLEL